jgi:hypothetical protein
MSWRLSTRVDLRNDRVSNEDADRQTLTAEEVLCRLDDQPGVVLADEVGMGKRPTLPSRSPCPCLMQPSGSAR